MPKHPRFAMATRLAERALEVLRLLAWGATNREIAAARISRSRPTSPGPYAS